MELGTQNEWRAGKGAQIVAQAEGTSHTGGEIAREVVGPSSRIDPSRGALVMAFDVERHRAIKRPTERNHRLGKLCRNLSNILDGSLRREPEHARLRFGTRSRNQEEARREEEQASREGAMARPAIDVSRTAEIQWPPPASARRQKCAARMRSHESWGKRYIKRQACESGRIKGR